MAKKQKAEAKASTSETVWPRIYVGPVIPKGYLKKNMVFANGFNSIVQDLIDKHPELNTLIVPTGDYVKALSEVNRVGSRLHSAYLKALKIIGD